MQLLSTRQHSDSAAQALADHMECEDNECRGMCVRTEDVYDKKSQNLKPQKKNSWPEGFSSQNNGSLLPGDVYKSWNKSLN